jgi:hypothetical protein
VGSLSWKFDTGFARKTSEAQIDSRLAERGLKKCASRTGGPTVPSWSCDQISERPLLDIAIANSSCRLRRLLLSARCSANGAYETLGFSGEESKNGSFGCRSAGVRATRSVSSEFWEWHLALEYDSLAALSSFR